MDERLGILSRWIERILGAPVCVRPASTDASFRRYFRVSHRGTDTYIVMDAPPEHESVEVFARVAGHFKELGLNVPLVFALDKTAGLALLSDLGTRTYLDEIDGENADRLYEAALNALHRLQTGSRDRLDTFEPYDRDKLMREMALFREWFVPCRTSNRLSTRDQGTIDGTFDTLVAAALEQPRVWVHRDFHSRNLMVTEVDNPGILDFQDAVSGPLTYDLVSLLRDCYISWPEERIDRWLRAYFDRIRDDPRLTAVTFEQFVRWFDWMGVQRHVKVLGIFSRLFHRDGKANYLDDLPLVYKYVCEVCDRYSELRPFKRLLESMDVQWTS
ncbi:MAG: phosphotransferase [Arenicellales bacterium]